MSDKPTRRPSHGRRARMVEQKQHDPYLNPAKPAQAMVCDECGVVQHGGKWYWGTPPLTDDHGGLCPACERIRDRYPAGTIRLHADVLEHKEEILGMVRRVEAAERAEHPLERIMAVEESPDAVVVTTTGIHIARKIASQLKRRFRGKVHVRYPEEQHLIFVDVAG